MIVKAQYDDHSYASSYNVGPDERDCIETGTLTDYFVNAWQDGLYWTSLSDNGPHEANFLQLDNSKVKKTFSWKPVWDAKTAVEKVVEYAKSDNKEGCVEAQIRAFFEAQESI